MRVVVLSGFYWGIYGEIFYLKSSDTGMLTKGEEETKAEPEPNANANAAFRIS